MTNEFTPNICQIIVAGQSFILFWNMEKILQAEVYFEGTIQWVDVFK
jgi:hypothetical protein